MSEKNKIITVNTITFTRIIGIFFIPFAVYNFKTFYVALFIGILWLTDTIDGILARKWDVSTLLGAILDVFADKLLEIAVLSYLSTLKKMMIIPLMLELLTLITNFVFGALGANVKSSKYGKIKTVIVGFLTAIAVLSTISSINILSVIIYVLIITTIIFEVITLTDYIIKNTKHLKEKNNKKNIHHKIKKWNKLKKDLISPKFHKEHLDEPILSKICDN